MLPARAKESAIFLFVMNYLESYVLKHCLCYVGRPVNINIIYMYVHRWSKCDAIRNAEPSNVLLSHVEIETLPKL